VDFVRPGEEVASSSWQLQSLGTTGKNSRRFPDLVGDWNHGILNDFPETVGNNNGDSW